MKTLVRISTQYYENYAAHNSDWDGKKEGWKPKGGQEFNIYADSDDFFYGEEACIEAIKCLLKEKSNLYVRFEYVEHEIIFSEPIILEGFEEKLNQIIESKNVNS